MILHRLDPTATPLLLAVVGLLPLTASCSDARAGQDEPGADEGAASVSAAAASRVEDAPVEGWRLELLDLAYAAASAFPHVPHAKNRARAQEEVVVACFELDQPHRALRYAGGIDNWRRGAAHADFALYSAERGDPTGVQAHLDRALEIARADEDAQLQGWRIDRVRAKIARVHLLLGQDEQAARMAAHLEESQAGIVEALYVEKAETAALEGYLDTVDAVVASASMDVVRSVLAGCARYFDRFYDDAERRDAALGKILAARDKMPLQVHVELLYELAGSARAHGDRDGALALVERAAETLDEVAWAPEDEVAQRARLAEELWLAGDGERARSGADAALELFEEHRGEIVDMFRGESLRPLAEAYHAMGDATALWIYRRALEESLENPNTRPRTDDLVALCVSMALHGCEPDEALWARLREIQAGLIEAW